MREVVQKPDPIKSLKFLYRSKFGGIILSLINRRSLSKLVGRYLDSRLSKRKIKRYIKKHGIDMSCFIEEEYKSFNAFFTRRIKPELRPFDPDKNALVSPCDGLVSAYEISPELEFNVKGFDYTVQSLLGGNTELASEFDGGLCIVFRLTVSDYHRYFFFDDGKAFGNAFIKGKLHTVQPIALENRRVFTENCREYTVLDTENFGRTVMVEVGAMMVGRIVNDVKDGEFTRGEEKGRFEFGGSTVILLLKRNAAVLDEEFFVNTRNDCETRVKCGEKIGVKATRDSIDSQSETVI